MFNFEPKVELILYSSNKMNYNLPYLNEVKIKRGWGGVKMWKFEYGCIIRYKVLIWSKSSD